MSKKILIIEDSQMIVHTLKDLFEKKGYEVITASNGQEGLDLYRTQGCDVILLDIKMPGMDGLKVLEAIRDEEREKGIIKGFGHVRIIMLTASNQDWTEALAYGCDDYILKPYNAEKLLKKINAK